MSLVYIWTGVTKQKGYMKKTICIDFDGMISMSGLPMADAKHGIASLILNGYDVVILTANKVTYVHDFLREHFPVFAPYLKDGSLRVTNTKPPAIAYVDDKAVPFTNWLDLIRRFR